MLPDQKLKMQVQLNGEFKIFTCFRMIQVPQNISKKEFMRNMFMCLDYAVDGFGSV